jgi:hypothetical protein
MSEIAWIALAVCVGLLPIPIQEIRYFLEDRSWAKKADYVLKVAELPLKIARDKK